MASCSRKISDPCENTNPQTTIDVNSDAIVCFESIDSYDLNYTNKNKITINGELFLPEIKKEAYNAVIMTHGSAGKRRYHKKYIELLTDMGLVVFQIDHYAARKIKYDKTKLSGQSQRIMDSSKMNQLGWDPKIDLYKGLEKTVSWFSENRSSIREK